MCSSQNDGTGGMTAAATGLLPVSFSLNFNLCHRRFSPDGIDRCARTIAADIILRIENFCNDD
jgi:hypothetical protein